MMREKAYLFERQLFSEVLTKHDHASNPEKHDIVSCFHQVQRVKLFQVCRLKHLLFKTVHFENLFQEYFNTHLLRPTKYCKGEER